MAWNKTVVVRSVWVSPSALLTGLGLLALFLPHIGVPMRAAIEAALTAFP